MQKRRYTMPNMPNLPAIPMVNILQQYAAGHNLPFDRKNWETVVRTFNHYNQTAKILN